MMADDCDRAEDRQEEVLADALAAVRRAPSLIPVGFCHHCGEAVHPGYLFCDKECASDYEHAQKMRLIAGR